MDFVDISLYEQPPENKHMNDSDVQANDLEKLITMKQDGNPQKIRDIVEQLEVSLESSRQDENLYLLHTAYLKAQNKYLVEQLEEANKKNKILIYMLQQKEDNTLMHKTDEGSNSGTSTSKPNGVIDNNKHNLQNSLKKHERQLRRKNQEVHCLRKQLTERDDKLIEREHTIETLCTKYLTLQYRKDTQLQMVQSKMTHLQKLLGEAYDVLQSSIMQHKIVTTDLLRDESEESLPIQEVHHSKHVIHESSIIRQQQRR